METKIYVIIEWTGGIELIKDKDGLTKKWETYDDAFSYAEEHCAFDYQIITLN